MRLDHDLDQEKAEFEATCDGETGQFQHEDWPKCIASESKEAVHFRVMFDAYSNRVG